ncbi:MAG: hypothetical protein HC936_16900 [Leptolyngbyaceae cyanobacterium SU_3_3]|nr:hypothetical protein [Leptolyngbyaceae cyanobacterium SU_3_3]
MPQPARFICQSYHPKPVDAAPAMPLCSFNLANSASIAVGESKKPRLKG